MRINPKKELLDLEGEPWVESGPTGDTPITLKHLIFMALNSPIPNEPWNAESRMKIFDICVKVAGANSAELDDGEPSLILDRADKLGNAFSPLAYARLCEFLKPPPKADAAKAGK